MFNFLCLPSNAHETLPSCSEHLSSLTPNHYLLQLRRSVAGVKSFREQQKSLRHQSFFYPLSPIKCLILVTSAKVTPITDSGFIHVPLTLENVFAFFTQEIGVFAKKHRLRQCKNDHPISKQFGLATKF